MQPHNNTFYYLYNPLFKVPIENYEKRIINIEGFLTSVSKKMTDSNSPLSLSIYTQQLFEDIQFYEVFDKIKDELVKELEKFNLRTKYDVQEMARHIFLNIRDNPLLDPLKIQVFKKGKNMDEVLAGTFLPLRDYYLKKHPEIKD